MTSRKKKYGDGNMNDPELLAQLNAMNDDSEKPEKKPKNLTEQIEIKKNLLRQNVRLR